MQQTLSLYSSNEIEPVELDVRDIGVRFVFDVGPYKRESIVVLDQQSVCSLTRLLSHAGIEFEQVVLKEHMFDEGSLYKATDSTRGSDIIPFEMGG